MGQVKCLVIVKRKCLQTDALLLIDVWQEPCARRQSREAYLEFPR